MILKLEPKLSPISSRSQTEGSYFHIVCSVEKGSVPLFFEWSKNGQTIKSSPQVNYKIENFEMHSILTIKSIDMKDVANYSCIVSNAFGSHMRSTLLSIKGRNLYIYYSYYSFEYIIFI